MLAPVIQKNDKQAKLLIGIFSVVVFVAVSFLSKFTINVQLPFDKHIFALLNALLNSAVAILLVLALVAIKQKKYTAHKNLMLTALILSVLFLVSYIAHHLLAGETKFGDTDHDGIVSVAEIAVAGNLRAFYFILLSTRNRAWIVFCTIYINIYPTNWCYFIIRKYSPNFITRSFHPVFNFISPKFVTFVHLFNHMRVFFRSWVNGP